VLDSSLAAMTVWPINDLFAATMSYEAWQARHFTPDELAQPSVSGDDSDPDGDGISNLVEYAQGLDPKVADTEPWLRGRWITEPGSPHLALEYRRRPLGHAVTYQLETSSDLTLWQPFQAVITEQLDPDGMVAVSASDPTTEPQRGSKFYRVKVRRSHPQAP
jgi:hypothetical protein